MKQKQPIQTKRHAGLFSLLLGCGLLLGMGCTSDTEPAQPSPIPSEMTRVTLQIIADGKAGANSPEDCIHTLRVYAYQQFKNEMKLVGYAYRESTDENTSLDLTTAPINFILPSAMTTFVAMANEDAVMSQSDTGADILHLDGTEEFPILSLGATSDNDQPSVTWSSDENGVYEDNLYGIGESAPLEKLKKLTFNKLPISIVAPNGNSEILPRLPMGVLTEASTNATTVTLRLKRSVAKVNFYFAKVAGKDTDKLYMGRGMYLYNQPPYGYLIPKTNTELTVFNKNFNFVETEQATEEDYDKVDQRNGYAILKAAGPNLPSEGHVTDKDIDINEITTVFNPPTEGGGWDPDKYYQQMPQKTFYLFANPYLAQIDNTQQKPTTTNNRGGYYVKILAHAHITGEEGTETSYNTGLFYVSLQEIKPNQHLRVCSAISLNGYLMLTPNWKVNSWTTHDIGVGFN